MFVQLHRNIRVDQRIGNWRFCHLLLAIRPMLRKFHAEISEQEYQRHDRRSDRNEFDMAIFYKHKSILQHIASRSPAAEIKEWNRHGGGGSAGKISAQSYRPGEGGGGSAISIEPLNHLKADISRR